MNSVDVPSLSHLDETGQARMVDVGDKVVTARVAVCEARVRMSPGAFGQLADHAVAKGDVLNTARVAGVLAAKRCAELIPLCHTLPLSFVGIDFALEAETGSVCINATCRSDYKTGVEMEAMMACSVAALTIYDMCKAADKGIVVEAVRLLYKAGGKSGAWLAPDLAEPPAAAFALGAAADGLPRRAGAAPQAGVDAQAAESARAAAPASPGSASTSRAAAQGDRASSLPDPAPRAVAKPADAALAGAALRLVFFARIAEQIGTREQTWPWPQPGTGEQLLRALGERFPQIEPVSRLKLAVNQQHARLDTRIVPGDEVAVFEPVTGG